MVLAELGGKLRETLRKLHTKQGNVTTQLLNDLLSDITRALIEADVNVKLVMKLRDAVKSKVEGLLQDDDDDEDNAADELTAAQRRSHAQLSKTVQRAVVDELVALLSPSDGKKAYNLRKGQSNIVLFVGLQGAGKTTTIAKYCHYYQKRGWKTCMVCADTFRAGAFDQLKQNATKLRVPFYGSYTQADPVQIAQDGVTQFVKDRYELIIVDTSGRHKQEAQLLEEMQEIAAAVQPHNTILVMDATQGQAVYDQALAFSQAVEVGSVIVTKLDGHAKGGGALSAVAATASPIVFLGSGEHFDDLDPFYAQSFVSKLLGFGDVRGLMEALKGTDSKEQQEEYVERMAKGEFTLRMMYSQFEKVMSMGSFGKLAGMIPGMPDYLVPKGGAGDEQATARLRKFMVMMDSMNNAELDGKVDLHHVDDKRESRIRRIAAGSGTHPNEVQMLLVTHKQFAGLVEKMGKSGLIGKKGQAQQQQLAQQYRKNPNLLQQRLNQMDPRLLQQMGGRENVMAMMQQMAKGGNPGAAGGGSMPDMSALMSSMGGGGMPPGMGGMPGMMPPGMGGSMPPGGMGGSMPPGGGLPPGMDMEAVMRMAQSMGMAPPGGAAPGGGRR